MCNTIKSKWAHLDHTSYFRRTEVHRSKIIPNIPIFYIIIARYMEIIEIDGTLGLKYPMEHASSDVDHLA